MIVSRVPLLIAPLMATRSHSSALPQASARQRAGRAGRSRPGEYYCLMPEAAFGSLPPNTAPEVQRCSLNGTVLQLKALGIDNVARFDFLSPPPPAALANALEALCALCFR